MCVCVCESSQQRDDCSRGLFGEKENSSVADTSLQQGAVHLLPSNFLSCDPSCDRKPRGNGSGTSAAPVTRKVVEFVSALQWSQKRELCERTYIYMYMLRVVMSWVQIPLEYSSNCVMLCCMSF